MILVRKLAAFLLVASSLAGCASTQYIYQPQAQVVALQAGRPTAQYMIPAEQPLGDMFVASYGVTEIEPTAGGAPRLHVLLVRMIVSNRGDDKPWTLDTRQQQVAMLGVVQSPAFVNTDAGALPSLQLGKGEQRTLDLYFALPPGVKKEDQLPAFEVIWQVQTGARVASGRTPFQRVEVEPAPDYYGNGPYPDSYVHYHVGVGFGWAPNWWYDPFWPHYRAFYAGPRFYPGYPRFFYGPRFGGGHPHFGGPRVHYGRPR